VMNGNFEERFARQTRFAALGPAGQERLAKKRVLIVGVGALGGMLAQSLTRSGVGLLVLVDRDIVDVTNLPRQVLFEDRHAHMGALKVDAARESLARIGGPTTIEIHAKHVDAANIAALAHGSDLVLDGTDNLATRYVINDLCVEQGRPWVYAGVVGAHGLVMPILPGTGPCLRCLFLDPPPPASLATCATHGVLQPAVGAIASLQAGLALRILVEDATLVPALCEIDVWDGSARTLHVTRAKDCPCCVARNFEFLRAAPAREAVGLCGRNAVQIQSRALGPDLALLARALAGVARNVEQRGAVLRFEVESQRFTVFADGRALIEGTDDEGVAIALYDRYVGS